MSMSSSRLANQRRHIAALLTLLVLILPTFGQTQPDPQKEQLLNGLPVLLWLKPGGTDVTVKLRIHSGAAFDLAGKAGEMSLLGDLLFPDRATIDYFTEMNGRLEVRVNYDSMTITLQGRAAEFDRIIEVLRNALLTTQLTPETVARVRESRTKIVRETTVSPDTLADRAIASRLFGDFPYGRPWAGSVEDLARVERADLMLARDRFLNPNNATLSIWGPVDKARSMRTLRQLLGAWRKSEQIVPTTFRQPLPPDSRTLVIGGPTPTAEIRLAVRGVARSDADFGALAVLAKIAQHRWETQDQSLAQKPIFVRSETHVLPGMFVMGTAVNNDAVVNTLTSARKALDSLVTSPPTIAEFERAKNEMLAELLGVLAKPDGLAESWLDVDTYRLASLNDQLTALHSLSAAAVQAVAGRLFKNPAIATIAVGDPQQLKTALQGHVQFEVLGEITAPPPPPKPATKPSGVSVP
jgi:predicted Zn-dependent peptidase